MSLVSIVVPVYHNAASLDPLMEKFRDLAIRNSEDEFEFLFVDDGSRDQSFAILQALVEADSRVRVLKLSRNFGSNPAIMAGLAQARGDVVAVIAADLQDPPELIDEMLMRWRDGHKVVLAARSSRDDPLLTTLLATTFYSLFRRFAIRTMPQGGFDFFLVDRQVCDLITGIEETNAYLMGLVLWFGFDPAVVHYHRRCRDARYGRSMWTLAKKLTYFVDSFVGFSYAPIRAVSLLGAFVSGTGLLYALWIVGLRLFGGVPVQGWASMMILLVVVSGVQMLMTGVLGEYLWRNLETTRRRPRYVIERTIESPLAVQTAAEPRRTKQAA